MTMVHPGDNTEFAPDCLRNGFIPAPPAIVGDLSPPHDH
jgi:hypothetical protein